MDSLRIYDAGLDVAVRQFVRQWETLAYAPASASTAVISARDNPVDSAPALGGEPAASDAAAFIRECLLITFRLT